MRSPGRMPLVPPSGTVSSVPSLEADDFERERPLADAADKLADFADPGARTSRFDEQADGPDDAPADGQRVEALDLLAKSLE